MMQDLVKNIIETNYNRYFKCGDVVNYVIASNHDVSFGHLIDCRKRVIDPYDKYRAGLTIKVARILYILKDAGFIEKYGRSVWRIV